VFLPLICPPVLSTEVAICPTAVLGTMVPRADDVTHSNGRVAVIHGGIGSSLGRLRQTVV
jgi:hypothetical protein